MPGCGESAPADPTSTGSPGQTTGTGHGKDPTTGRAARPQRCVVTMRSPLPDRAAAAADSGRCLADTSHADTCQGQLEPTGFIRQGQKVLRDRTLDPTHRYAVPVRQGPNAVRARDPAGRHGAGPVEDGRRWSGTPAGVPQLVRSNGGVVSGFTPARTARSSRRAAL